MHVEINAVMEYNSTVPEAKFSHMYLWDDDDGDALAEQKIMFFNGQAQGLKIDNVPLNSAGKTYCERGDVLDVT